MRALLLALLFLSACATAPKVCAPVEMSEDKSVRNCCQVDGGMVCPEGVR